MKSLGIIDEIVTEPIGGAHRNTQEVFANLRKAIQTNLNNLSKLSGEELKKQRTEKFFKMTVNLGKKQ